MVNPTKIIVKIRIFLPSTSIFLFNRKDQSGSFCEGKELLLNHKINNQLRSAVLQIIDFERQIGL